GQRINAWLHEPDHETFKHGKWRFWLPMLMIFVALNAVLTAWIFGWEGGQAKIGAIMVSVGALLCWLCVGTLHCSGSRHAPLARGVSALDSLTLCFVVAHFCFLLWVQGRLLTLQSQEARYEAGASAFNQKAEKISGDNVRIAEAGAAAAREATKTARL